MSTDAQKTNGAEVVARSLVASIINLRGVRDALQLSKGQTELQRAATLQVARTELALISSRLTELVTLLGFNPTALGAELLEAHVKAKRPPLAAVPATPHNDDGGAGGAA